MQKEEAKHPEEKRYLLFPQATLGPGYREDPQLGIKVNVTSYYIHFINFFNNFPVHRHVPSNLGAKKAYQ